MIRIRRPPEADALDSRTRAYLAMRQAKANGYGPRSPEIQPAWSAFLGTRVKDRVTKALDGYTHTKCAYCEQVAAKDIEHFYPNSGFPDRMFRWTNFLRGCKNCNHAKRDTFPRTNGEPVLIDPCKEDPLDFFRWDSLTGGMGVNPGQPFRTRAETTRDLFGLDQEPLREERRQKLLDVLYLLAKVVEEQPVSRETEVRLRDHLAPRRPWLGIVRQLLRFPGPHRALVAAARAKLPDIDDWTAGWV